jgi:uncharacterized membrane protein YeaQ/YmgE (transglycosylase-associated protein family)
MHPTPTPSSFTERRLDKFSPAVPSAGLPLRNRPCLDKTENPGYLRPDLFCIAGYQTSRTCDRLSTAWSASMLPFKPMDLTVRKESLMSGEGILVILLVGVIAGWLAGQIVRGTGFGLIADLCIGVVGALIGSWLLPQLDIGLGTGIVAAIVAAPSASSCR